MCVHNNTGFTEPLESVKSGSEGPVSLCIFFEHQEWKNRPERSKEEKKEGRKEVQGMSKK